MKQNITTFIFMVCLSLAGAGCTTKGGNQGDLPSNFLKVSGTEIRDHAGKGNPVALRGINLGGWLLREGWMDPIGFDNTSSSQFMDDYGSRTLMIERFGEQETDRMLDYYQKVYIKESDLDTIKKLGLNFVRVPVFWEVLLNRKGLLKDNAFDRLDWVVEECRKRDMYVIIDLHGAPGGHSDGYQTGGTLGSNLLWTDPTCLEWTIVIWQTIAPHFRGNATVLAYDLLNEPVADPKGKYSNSSMYDLLYQRVREVDPDHIIMMGAFYNFDYLCDPDDYGWTNVVYQTHHYMSDNRGDENGQRGFMEGQLSYVRKYQQLWNVPVYPGEYNFWNHPMVWNDWLSGLNSYGMMWSSWTYKNIDSDPVNSWGIYVNNTAPTPDLRVDTPEQICAKWDAFSSDNYQYNETLANVIRMATME